MTNEKHFPKTTSQWEFDYGLLTNLPRIIAACFLPSSFRLKRGILPLVTKYLSYCEEMHILKTTCHIKLRFFLWTKLQEKLLLVKYLIFVAATLILLKKRHYSTFQNKSSEISRIQIAEKLFHFFFLCNQVKTFLLSICPWIIILIKLYVFKKRQWLINALTILCKTFW